MLKIRTATVFAPEKIQDCPYLATRVIRVERSTTTFQRKVGADFIPDASPSGATGI